MTLNITTRSNAYEAREVAFTIDDREYTVPVEVDATVGMMATDLMATQGEAVAIRYTMIAMLGDEGYQSLLREKGLSKKDFQAIQEVLREKALGGMEDDTSGNS